MPAEDDHRSSRLSIEVEPGLRGRIEAADGAGQLSVRDDVVAALRRDLDDVSGDEPSISDGEWTALSVGSFQRDWNSEADAVYDDLA